MTNTLQESSGNYLSPVHHHLEECQPLLIIRTVGIYVRFCVGTKVCERMYSLSSPR